MISATQTSSEPCCIHAPAGDGTDDAWARPLLDRQLHLLAELAELGLGVARVVERRATESPPLALGEVSLAYSRVSRAVRLTIMLQAKLVEEAKAADRQGAQARTAAEAEAKKACEIQTPAYQAKARIEAIVERVAEAHHPADEDEVDRVIREAAERLDDEDLYGDLLERPVSELVARLCKDLGLHPDWAELAQELWATRELESGEVGWPLARWAPLERSSPLAGEGGHEVVERVVSFRSG